MTATVSPPQLSVLELQQALADARSRATQRHTVAAVAVRREPSAPHSDDCAVLGALRANTTLVVVAAHAGAGASTVALALADAAASDGTPVRLVDCAPAGESGLTEAATEVLGVDRSGQWYRGRRGGVLIEHATATADDPGPGQAPAPQVTVVDAGPASTTSRATTATAAGVVVACHASAPGFRRAEAVVASIGVPVVVTAIGPRKWPRVVHASLGPALTALRRDGRLVSIPTDPHLACAGLTAEPLPRRVLAGAREALTLMHLTRTPAQDAADRPKELAS